MSPLTVPMHIPRALSKRGFLWPELGHAMWGIYGIVELGFFNLCWLSLLSVCQASFTFHASTAPSGPASSCTEASVWAATGQMVSELGSEIGGILGWHHGNAIGAGSLERGFDLESVHHGWWRLIVKNDSNHRASLVLPVLSCKVNLHVFMQGLDVQHVLTIGKHLLDSCFEHHC